MNDDGLPILTTRQAHDAATARGELARASRRGELARLRHGAYSPAAELLTADRTVRHLALIRAARLAAESEPVFSHESAAVLHRMPLLGALPERVVVTVPIGGGGSTKAVERRQRPLDPDDVTTLTDGTRATSPARTAIDLATRRSLLNGIVAISHVRAAGVSEATLAGILHGRGAATGVERGRRALARSTRGSESVLETLVVVRCQDYGFAAPEQQRAVRGADGRTYRVDFAWCDGRILGEADGRAKYLDPELRGDRSAEDVIWDEKRREDALRAVADRLVRFGWSDAWNGEGLRRRLEALGVPRTGRPLSALTF